MSATSKNIRSSLRHRDNPMNVIYVHDLKGKLTFLNQRGEQLLGYSREEVCNMNISEIVTPEIAPRVRDKILDSTNRRIGLVYDIEVIAKDGHRVPLEVSTSVVFHEGQPVEIEGIAVPPIRWEAEPAISKRSHSQNLLVPWFERLLCGPWVYPWE